MLDFGKKKDIGAISGGEAHSHANFWFVGAVHYPFAYPMAKKSTWVRQLNPKYPVRAVNRCFKCGRKRGYMRDFDLCRVCFRELANEGKIPGIKKASW